MNRHLFFNIMPTPFPEMKMWGARWHDYTFVVSFQPDLKFTFSVKEDGTRGFVGGGPERSFDTFEHAHEACDDWLRSKTQ